MIYQQARTVRHFVVSTDRHLQIVDASLADSLRTTLVFVSMGTAWCGRGSRAVLSGASLTAPPPWPSRAPTPGHVWAQRLDTGSALNVTVQVGAASGLARLDLHSLEIVLVPPGALIPARLVVMGYALRLVLDRLRHEQQRAPYQRRDLPYTLSDPSTWTPMQRLATMNSAWWYPPFPERDASAPVWNAFWAEVRTAQRHFRFAFAAPATTAHRSASPPPPADPHEVDDTPGSH